MKADAASTCLHSSPFRPPHTCALAQRAMRNHNERVKKFPGNFWGTPRTREIGTIAVFSLLAHEDVASHRSALSQVQTLFRRLFTKWDRYGRILLPIPSTCIFTRRLSVSTPSDFTFSARLEACTNTKNQRKQHVPCPPPSSNSQKKQEKKKKYSGVGTKNDTIDEKTTRYLPPLAPSRLPRPSDNSPPSLQQHSAPPRSPPRCLLCSHS